MIGDRVGDDRYLAGGQGEASAWGHRHRGGGYSLNIHMTRARTISERRTPSHQRTSELTCVIHPPYGTDTVRPSKPWTIARTLQESEVTAWLDSRTSRNCQRPCEKSDGAWAVDERRQPQPSRLSEPHNPRPNQGRPAR
jgi:hypothetical protein